MAEFHVRFSAEPSILTLFAGPIEGLVSSCIDWSGMIFLNRGEFIKIIQENKIDLVCDSLG